MARAIGLLLILVPMLGACGLRGDLARPPPWIGEDRRTYEAQRAEEAARAAAEAAAAQKRKAEAESAAAAPTP